MKIRKTYQGVVPNGKVLNSKSDSQIDTYSCDYLNKNKEIYSTEELRIGTWIDGKPLYRKVIRVHNFTVSKTAEINTDITNFDKLVKISGLFENYSNSKYAPYPIYDTDPTNLLQVYVTWDGTKIKFDGNTSWTQNPNRYHTFILEYTKTTD